jgi:hypothetical protein
MCCVGAAIGRARYNCLYHVHVGYGLWLCLQGPCLCLPVHVCVCVCVCVYCLLCYLRFLTYPKPTKAAVPDRLITPPSPPLDGAWRAVLPEDGAWLDHAKCQCQCQY